MKVIKLLLIFLLFTVAAKASYIDTVKTLLKERKFSKVMSFLRLKDSVKGSYLEYYETLNRDIVIGYKEIKIDVEESTPTEEKNTYSVYPYTMNLIVKGDSIVYCKLINLDIVGLPLRVLKYKSGRELRQLRRNFKKIYGKRLKLKKLFQGFKEGYEYGKKCGRSYKETIFRVKLIHAVENSDVKTLRKWTSSTITEVQVYGVEGLFQLKQKGFIPSTQDIKRVNAIKNKEGELYTCRGCIGTLTSIKEVTKDFVFD